MLRNFFRCSIVFFVVCALDGVLSLELFNSVVFAEWTLLNFTWNHIHTYEEYSRTKKYIPHNCALAGINVDKKGNIYVTVPRWRTGVPATLNKLEISPAGSAEQYTLTPYPSWEVQRVGVEGDLQSCQSMTIDSQGRMWVVETGRRNFLSPDSKQFVSGAAGVWLIDLETNAVLSKYYFPDSVASYETSFVNDIVLDEARNLAYLTDAGGGSSGTSGGLLVYDHAAGTSRRYSGASTMNSPDYVMVIDGTDYGSDIFTTPSDGLAITEDCEALLYCAVQGTTLYRLPTAVLRDWASTSEQIDAAVQAIGAKNPSDGMKYLDGVLYYGDLPSSTYHALPITSTSFPDTIADAVTAPVGSDPINLRWVSDK
jgi:hypothetical protein